MNNKITKLLFPTVASTVIGFSSILGSFGTAFAAQSTIITSPVKQAISNVVLYLQDSSGNFIKVKVDNFSAVHETKTYDPTSVLQNYSGYTLVAYTVKAGNNKSNMGPGEGDLVIVGSGVQENKLPTGSATYTYEYKAVYNTSTVSSSTTTTSTTNTSNNSTTNSVDSNVNTVSSETNSSTEPAPVNEPTVVSSETNSNTEPAPVNEPTVVSSETKEEISAPVAKSSFVSSNNAETTKPVSVPEPGTITAVALFGLGGLLTKKKLKSSSR